MLFRSVSDLRKHRHDYGIDADDWSSITVSLLWRLEYVRHDDWNRSASKCLSTIAIIADKQAQIRRIRLQSYPSDILCGYEIAST